MENGETKLEKKRISLKKRNMFFITLLVLSLIFGSAIAVEADIELAPKEVGDAPVMWAGLAILVEDAMSGVLLDNATVMIFNSDWDFIEYAARSDEHLLVSDLVYSEENVIYLVAWDEDHYMQVFEYIVPVYPLGDRSYFLTRIKLFKICSDVAVDISSPIGEFPVNMTEGRIYVQIHLNEPDTRFGNLGIWVNPDTEYEYTEGMVVLATNISLNIIEYTYTWRTLDTIYYAFSFGVLYNDFDVEGDDFSLHRISLSLDVNCEIGIMVTDSLRCSPNKDYIPQLDTTLTYVNGTLNYTGNVRVDYGYQPDYVFPGEYIPLSDLNVEWGGGGYEPGSDTDINFPLMMVVISPVLVCAIWLIVINDSSRRRRRRRRIERVARRIEQNERENDNPKFGMHYNAERSRERQRQKREYDDSG